MKHSGFNRLIRRLVPHGFDFVSQFELLALCTHQAATQLEDMMISPREIQTVSKALESTEKTADTHARTIHEELRASFITPIDREDISSLARQLDDVVDLLEAAGQNVKISAEIFRDLLDQDDLFISGTTAQISLLVRATECLPGAVQALRGIDRRVSSDIDEIQRRVHKIEQAGDDVWINIKNKRAVFLKEREKTPLTGRDHHVLLWVETVCHQLENCLDVVKQTVDHISDIIAKFA